MRHEEHVRRQTPLPCSWRLEDWPTDNSIGHLIFRDHRHPINAADLDRAVETASREGRRLIRTSALFPDQTRPIIEYGFRPADELILMRRTLDPSYRPTTSHRTDRMRPWHYRAAAAIDQRAFGDGWGYDARSLNNVRGATPQFRARIVRSQRGIVGFALSGLTETTGFLQRLAVDPAHQRHGYARALVSDTIEWAAASGAGSLLVNTGIDNHGAQALYTTLGFHDTGEILTVADLAIDRG